MFSKTALTLLALGALYVNALTVPIARSPAPEPEFQDLMARLDFELAKREFLDGLFSREPEDWIQESKRATAAHPAKPHRALKCADLPRGSHLYCH